MSGADDETYLDDPTAAEARAEGARREPTAPEVDRAFIESILTPYRKLRDYCRVSVEGLENVPKGGAVLVANHTGWAGLDHSNLVVTLYEHDGRIPRTAVHPAWFRLHAMRKLGHRLGLFEVSVQTSLKIIEDGGIVLFYPEAEEGNFKPIWKYYQLEDFKPGFARVALAAQADIIPVVIIGGEEAHPSLGRIDATKKRLGMSLPVPLNLWPLPVKWRIAILPPVPISKYMEGESVDAEVAKHIADDVRALMQKEIQRQLKMRGNPWI